ncbi:MULTISPECIES: lysine N(6)-hydroxylase/L-ornithine N(5)-oxygenase family protein [Micromonospora]|uniref:lysine N(6)-hydroxylase/L-ornithine N(5)-oxygenase family protein n=1 Tax=Micromonospora TaxID=1873 RepID=UPI003C27E4E2
MTQTFHTVGIGAGPANLSLAAMYDTLAPHDIALFEARDRPGWHDGMLHSGVRMQTGWVKDLVSLYDPTHPLSFLNYLVTTGRVYALLGAGFDTIPRIEYQQYLVWAAGRLPRITYGTRVDRVEFDGTLVSRSGGAEVARSRHLVLGSGTVPFVPEFLDALDPRHLFVADELHRRLATVPDEPDLPWIVIGSGQTSAECVAALLARGCRDIRWIGRRSWFAPLEDSPSANDLYRPAYQEAFLTLSRDVRERLVSGQILTSDGISPGTLRGVYQHNYEERLRTGRFPVTIMPSRTVTGARQLDGEVELECLTAGSGEERHRAVNLVVAAGRRQAPLPFDPELTALIDLDERGEPVIESDYSIRWKHADDHKIFVLNRGRYVQGLVDSNLSILPIRSAMILNSIAGRTVCRFRDDYLSTRWA